MNLITIADGRQVDTDSVPQSFAYNGDGTLQYTQVTYRGSLFRQTLTYTAGKITAISAWIKQ